MKSVVVVVVVFDKGPDFSWTGTIEANSIVVVPLSQNRRAVPTKRDAETLLKGKMTLT